MYNYVMLILINQCSLNCITKDLNGQNSSKQNFHSSCDFIACELIEYHGLQISGNKPGETPYLML